MKPVILIADQISEIGIEALRASDHFEVRVQIGLKGDALLAAVADVNAIVVRSQTKITEEVIQAAPKLQAVGRAGVGVDNVDVDAATQRGVVVMNTPAGNTISTAEHAFSLMMSMARRIPQAHASVVAGKWDRKSFEGVELYNKNLAVLGMGRIGTEFARRAIAFGMRVYAYDPYITASRARALQVELIEKLDDILPLADFVTLHMPLTSETRHMLNAPRMRAMRPDARIVNCARGGLIDEAGLARVLEEGHLGGVALDVYEQEPPAEAFALRAHPKMVFTPHLGASTVEAQEGVGVEIAESIQAALVDGVFRNAVNMPNVDKQVLELLRPYLSLGERLGRFVSQLSTQRCESLQVTFSGRVGEFDTTPVSRAVLKGYLERVGGAEVNMVNAPSLAKSLGLEVSERRQGATGEFTDLIEVSAGCGAEQVSVAGTYFGAAPRIVKVNQSFVEAKPEGVILYLENRDRPGIVGQLGTILGAHQVNIARMSLGRNEAGGRALTLLNLDTEPGKELMDSLLADPDIYLVRSIVV
ncbi:MAG: phosphoglycerate dehydrogenase [Verrucomicrobiales bacterium]